MKSFGKPAIKPSILMFILSAITALSLACGPSAAPTPVAPISGTVPPIPTTSPTPAPPPATTGRPAATPIPATSEGPASTPTPAAPAEWELQNIDVAGSTVRVILRVFAGVDVRVTLDGAPAQLVSGPPPVFEDVFTGLAPGVHTINVSDLAGNTEAREVSIAPPIVSAGLPSWLRPDARNSDGNPDSPQVVVFLATIIDVAVGF